jgi:hypothetical protein
VGVVLAGEEPEVPHGKMLSVAGPKLQIVLASGSSYECVSKRQGMTRVKEAKVIGSSPADVLIDRQTNERRKDPIDGILLSSTHSVEHFSYGNWGTNHCLARICEFDPTLQEFGVTLAEDFDNDIRVQKHSAHLKMRFKRSSFRRLRTYVSVSGRSVLSFQRPITDNMAALRSAFLSRYFSRTACRTSSEIVLLDCLARICRTFQTSSSM